MARWKGPALFVLALVFVLTPHLAFAQSGIVGTVRDSSGGVLPGVTVEASSPQLIEKVRATVTDENGRFQIAGLPVGTYTVTFKLEKFATVSREKVELSNDFTATVNTDMKLGAASEIVTVVGTEGSGQVDVINARQRQVFSREELIDLPTTRNLNSLIQLVPGIAVSAANAGTSVPSICMGGQADGGGGFNTSGALSGCTPLIQGFNAHSSMNDPDSINQGRMQVDGMGVQSFGGGGRSNYVADISNAQEVTFTLSGSLGESETGGTTINVIPRTGGNRYSGNFYTAYSDGHFFGKNNDTRTSTFQNRLDREYDVNGSYGGPILRDRLWFYAAARRQDRNSLLTTAYRNLNEGIYGANFRRDVNSRVMQDDYYQNASMRLTLQASQRNKFNIFWDEQYTCENPCGGTSGSPTSVEASSSPISHPLHLAQLSWTNPFTSKILLEAGVSHYGSHRDESKNINEIAYPDIPRVTESGSTVDAINATATTTGSINQATRWNIDTIQSRASASYVTGSHNVKLGYQGQYLSRVSDPYFNTYRLAYAYATPASTCSTTAPAMGAVNNGNNWCGLAPDGSANNATRIPVPNTVTEFIPSGSDESVLFSSFYLQDQWTLNRLTFSGALRYDNAQSNFGKTCVGPDVHTQYQYCLNDPANGDDGRGVYFQDITPRWGVTWDVFGNGKTALKYSMGKYLQGASVGGIYTASNPATGGRTINSYTRLWRDIDGDRIADCDLSVPATAPNSSSFPNSGECGPTTDTFTNTARRFGRSPDDLDDSGQAIGLGTLYCGQWERSMSAAISNYCQNYLSQGGKPLLDGWGVRQYEWQLSIGIQHEVLPRFSAEVTYNRRQGGNQTISDLIGSGCDLYSLTPGGTVDSKTCMENLLNFNSPTYDFYGVQAPNHPGLPGGGGYVVPGFATLKQTGCTATNPDTGACTNASFATLPASAGVNAITLVADGARQDFWSGIDTNFVLRARGGLRLSGGTSTGRRVNDTCNLMVNDPPDGQILREGRERLCDAVRPMQTNVRGTVSYTIPWIDVLSSAVFSVRPGVTINATYTVPVTDLAYQDGAVRYTSQLSGGGATVAQNLLSNDTFGEHIRLVDFKLAKNIRFAGKRINIGADVYNVFNSDAALGYCGTFPNPAQAIEGCGNAAQGTLVPWRAVNNITTPRYARFTLQFDF